MTFSCSPDCFTVPSGKSLWEDCQFTFSLDCAVGKRTAWALTAQETGSALLMGVLPLWTNRCCSGSSLVPNIPLLSGTPQVSQMQNGYKSVAPLMSGEKAYSPKGEGLLTASCGWGTDQGLPATLVSVPLSAFCCGWCQNSTVTISFTKAPG